ncbi:hypothetical protein EX30DRAFT_301764 [Ascodesmis nigricans]|uniref:DNA replication regulator Sld3 C-terminal domain-containing protein n=1 Tax=Ascodesmis nigricans TaxID=341454 RepID=A0A4S2N732_9PEZI|nr:hypothetical protein EX30DRAFT_301764 [Ascodesmis nigricans]
MSLLPPPSARKRKREEELGPSVLIGAHAESPFDNPVRIIPTIVLPRAYFPLQWLSGVPARLYHCSNHIPALSEPGKIAVVKMEGERQLSAVESLEKDAYVLYKLSTQVRLKDVRKLYAQLSRLRMDGEPTERVEYKDAWWEDIGSMTYPFTEHPLMPRQLESITERATPLNPDVVSESAESPRQTSAEVLENLRNQYYESLYLTKTSLAYFSKSALSRARAYFQGDDPETPSPIGELTAFLHSMLVPLSNMDSKHRKTLPTFVSEEHIDNISILKKDEETYLQNWRTSAFGDRVLAPTDPRVKCVLEKLKTRE